MAFFPLLGLFFLCYGSFQSLGSCIAPDLQGRSVVPLATGMGRSAFLASLAEEKLAKIHSSSTPKKTKKGTNPPSKPVVTSHAHPIHVLTGRGDEGGGGGVINSSAGLRICRRSTMKSDSNSVQTTPKSKKTSTREASVQKRQRSLLPRLRPHLPPAGLQEKVHGPLGARSPGLVASRSDRAHQLLLAIGISYPGYPNLLSVRATSETLWTKQQDPDFW